MKRFSCLIVVLLLSIGALNLISQVRVNPNVVGGYDANILDLPWQVGMFSNNDDEDDVNFRCGGSIIDSTWVITAAHCVVGRQPNEFKLMFGSEIKSNLNNEITRYVSQIIIYPTYFKDSHLGDIALLRLSEPLPSNNPKIKSIELVSPSDSVNGITDAGVIGTTSGWGTLVYGGSSPKILQSVKLPIVDVNTANSWLDERYPSKRNRVTNDMIPAGLKEGGVSSCHGDSGGPLVVKDEEGTNKLAGVVSWGYICGEKKSTGQYSRVSNKYNWIIENTKIGEPKIIVQNGVALAGLNITDTMASAGVEPIKLGSYTVLNESIAVLSKFKMDIKIRNFNNDVVFSKNKEVFLGKSLKSGSSVDITLPEIPSLPIGRYEVEVELSNPNGIADGYMANNLLKRRVEIVQGYPFRLKVNTKFSIYHDDMPFYIIDMRSGKEVFRKDIPVVNYKIDFDKTYYFPEGMYQIITLIYDEGNVDIFTYDSLGVEYKIASNDENHYYFSTILELPFKLKYDLALNLEPKGLFFLKEIPMCSILEEDELEVIIINNSSIQIFSQNLSIEMNGEKTENIVLNHTLNPGESVIESFRANASAGENKIKVTANYMNYSIPDENKTNEIDISSFIKVYPPNFRIKISKDFQDYDDKLEIILQDSIIYETISDHIGLSGEEKQLCIPNECFKIRATDNNFDGMYIQNAVVVYDANNEIIFTIPGTEWGAYKEWTVCPPVSSIEYSQNEETSISPNPANDNANLKVQIERNSIYNLIIYDMLGNVVQSKDLSLHEGENDIQLNLEGLSIGVYNVLLKSDNEIISNRVVVGK